MMKKMETKFGHIFTYDCYLKNLVRTPTVIYPYGWGKNRFMLPIT